MRRLFGFIATFLANQWRQFTPTGQLLYVMFIIAVIVDAAIAYQYGISMSRMHAAGFALVAVAFALLPDIAAREADRKSWTSAFVIGACCLPLGIVSYQSHIGYGAGVRLGDMQATQVQADKVAVVRDSLTDERASLKMWRGQLADLKARNQEHLKKNNGWLVTADPTAMQSQLDAMDKRIANEAARVKCGTKCEALMSQRGQLAALIAGIKEENDLTDRIERTQRIVDDKAKLAIETKPKSSVVVNQNDALGQLWHLVVGTQPEAKVVNLAAMGNSSLAFLMLAPLLGYAAGRNRWRRYMLGTHEDDTDGDEPPPGNKAPHTAAFAAMRGIPSEPQHIHTTETIHVKDATLRQWALSDEVRSLFGPQLKAA